MSDLPAVDVVIVAYNSRDTLRSWTSLTLMSALDNKPAELVSLALSRAKFCELVARHQNAPNPDTYYAVGMLSLLDVMFDTPGKARLEHRTPDHVYDLGAFAVEGRSASVFRVRAGFGRARS